MCLSHRSVTKDQTERNMISTQRFSSSFCFPFWKCSICLVLFLTDIANLFVTLARQNLPLLEYADEFSQLAVLMAFDDMMLISLFWIGANHHQPVDLPDTTGLSWREAIIRCLESVYPWSRTTPHPEPSPPSSRCAEPKPEPTTDGEPCMPATINEPSPRSATELEIIPEPEPLGASEQVCAGNSARREGVGHGQRESGGKLRPPHHGWGWAELCGL